MTTPPSGMPHPSLSQGRHLLRSVLAVLVAVAAAIVLAMAVNGAGAGPTKAAKASAVFPGTGVSLGRDPQVQLRLFKQRVAAAKQRRQARESPRKRGSSMSGEGRYVSHRALRAKPLEGSLPSSSHVFVPGAPLEAGGTSAFGR